MLCLDKQRKSFAGQVLIPNMLKTDHLFMPEDHMDRLYHSRNPLVRLVHNQRLNTIANLIPSSKNLAILDAGCGEGHLLERLYRKNPAHRYFGVDVTDVALKKARQRCPFAEIYQMNLGNLSLGNDYFDVVVCTETLEHIFEYQLVSQELKRVLKKNGYFLLTFPNEFLWRISRLFLRRQSMKIPDHVNSFAPQKMTQLIGLKLVRQINLPFPLPFFSSLGTLMQFQK